MNFHMKDGLEVEFAAYKGVMMKELRISADVIYIRL